MLLVLLTDKIIQYDMSVCTLKVQNICLKFSVNNFQIAHPVVRV
jgi:hypothetical protein